MRTADQIITETDVADRVANQPVLIGTSMAQRRWQLFRNHRRGFYSLVIFLLLFIISLGSEFLANDRPLLIVIDGKVFFPVFVDYLETDFGGDFPSVVNYHDHIIFAEIREQASLIIRAPIPYSYDTYIQDLNTPFPAPPDGNHLLGTDDQGRDVLALILYSFRTSVLFGLVLTLISSIIGVFAGLIQGFFAGWIDLLAQRAIEIWSALPSLYILITVFSIFERSFFSILIVMLLFSWITLVALVRAEAFRVRALDYVLAARVLGVSEWRIMLRHVLPNSLTTALTFVPFIIAGSIGTLAALDLIGFGLPAGSASLGELLLQGRNNLQSPWLGFTGFFTTGIMLGLLVMVGEGVRHAMDPRQTSVV